MYGLGLAHIFQESMTMVHLNIKTQSSFVEIIKQYKTKLEDYII
jgi:hypothetical protein